MSGHRRQFSPPPSRRYGDPRASTGMVFSSSFDPQYSKNPRHSTDLLSSKSSRPYEALPVSKKTYLDPGYGGSTSRTEYALRPRHNSVEAGARRPLSVMIPPNSQELSRHRPVISDTGHDRPRSPVPKIYHPKDDSGRYVVPAVSSPRHHKRHSSATPDEHPHISVERDRRNRAGSYVKSSAGKQYTLHPPAARYQEPDGYSYTGPREQFDRDYPAPRPRRNSYTRSERPMSVIDPPEWVPSAPVRREPGPPPASARQFDRIGRSESHRGIPRSGASSDTERDPSLTRRRHSRTRAPVSLHQDRDEGYSSQRDEHGERREHREHRPRKDRYDEDRYASDRDRPHYTSHHERRHSRNRNESRDRNHFGAGLAAAGLGTLAATSIVGSAGKESREKESEVSRESRESRREQKERRYHDGDREYEQIPRDREHHSDKARDRPLEQMEDGSNRDLRRDRLQKDRSDSDSQEKHNIRREKRHRRRHDKDHASRDMESESGSDYRPKDAALREQSEQDSESDAYYQQKRGKHRRHRQDSKVSSDNDTHTDAPQAPEEERQRKVQLVEPPKEKESEMRPKGILKRPKPAFPEDPNPTREGVAPLKDAGKKGIPPGARWTKINRLLVNPAALEDAHERFEERDDYVIVLRVLSREEIQKFADKTKEIRGGFIPVLPQPYPPLP